MHARKFILFKFIVRDAEVFPDINLILHIRIIHICSLLFLRYMLQPLRTKFTVLSCFETNIYLRLFLRGLLGTGQKVWGGGGGVGRSIWKCG